MVRRQYRLISLVTALAAITSGCGFDPTAEEYDRLRFDELQKSDCNTLADMGSRRMFKAKDSKETYETILERCRKMQAMSFDEYRATATKARTDGTSFEEAAAAAQANNVATPQ